jgi:SAM-dependent methyltransferase
LNSEEYGIMYRVEDHHWWYKGMERITRLVLDRWVSGNPRLRILDAGCGTGAALAGYLKDYGQVTGFDLAHEAMRYCKYRHIDCLARASVVSIPFRSLIFDLVTSFDVLCERSIRDDLAALKEFHRVLVPGGQVLLRLPAMKWLRGRHDQAVYIARRYTRREVAERLTSAGFTVQHISYGNAVFLPLIWLKRYVERLFPPRKISSDLTFNVGPINGLLQTILSSEAPLVARGWLPVGVSLFAVGQKSGG